MLNVQDPSHGYFVFSSQARSLTGKLSKYRLPPAELSSHREEEQQEVEAQEEEEEDVEEVEVEEEEEVVEEVGVCKNRAAPSVKYLFLKSAHVNIAPPECVDQLLSASRFQRPRQWRRRRRWT